VDEDSTIYGIDASPSMVQIFRQNFPNFPVEYEVAEGSAFFNRHFDAIITLELLFVLPEETQEVEIHDSKNGY
jgi:2-polyprenyl-3-methyl-5-hydroxy-6-metoxy-1,4-benzoquinol methylase